ncbi:MAG: hypothetical protein NTV61_10380 [Candidatus Bathyarchaeota archaeon]|nr:hypothetical protein [Candidatus Bathyarchaeota archaeon]
MVDLVEIQAAYYMVAATGVLVAAIYYILNMRATQRNMNLTLETRRISLIDNLTTRIMNKEGMRNYFELMNYEWKDYEDFERKYGSDNNVDATATRYSLLIDYNSMGVMFRKGLIRIEDLYDMGIIGVVFLWAKYKPIIEEGRRRYNGKNYLRDFEYLAGEILSYVKASDTDYRLPETLTKFIPDK